MRYRIVAWKFPTGYHVIVTEEHEYWERTDTQQRSLFLPYGDLKEDDLMHFLGELHRMVGEVTP